MCINKTKVCVHVTGTGFNPPGRIQKMNPSRAAVRDYRGSMSLVFDPDFRNQASEDTTKPSSNPLRRWTTRRLRSSSSDGDVSDAKPKPCTCRREQMILDQPEERLIQVLQELPSYEFRNGDYDIMQPRFEQIK